eukprot:6301829-Prymnesium_polylepis.1
MNAREENDSTMYSEAVVSSYRAGILAVARSTYSSSARWWSTCKPLTGTTLPSEQQDTTFRTRTKRLQAALDSMARMRFADHRHVGYAPTGLVAGMIDNTALLAGFERYAEDGRHYRGKGAVTMVNGHLNELFGM